MIVAPIPQTSRYGIRLVLEHTAQAPGYFIAVIIMLDVACKISVRTPNRSSIVFTFYVIFERIWITTVIFDTHSDSNTNTKLNDGSEILKLHHLSFERATNEDYSVCLCVPYMCNVHAHCAISNFAETGHSAFFGETQRAAFSMRQIFAD